MTEADTCRKFVVPLLQKAGWDNDPHSIAEQRFFTAGRIVSQGPTARRRPGKRADYLLRYTRDLPLAVVEAKAAYKHPADGLQQAKDYAQILGLNFAYATNGTAIIEFDFTTGQERQLTDFPTPQDLWARYGNKQNLTDSAAVERFLTPFNLTTGKTPHYYQRIAIDRVIQAILTRRQRADRVKKQEAAFFAYYVPEAREILNDLLEKYAIDGEIQFTLPDVLKVAPIWRHGNVAEIARKFGGVDALRSAVNQLQSLLYAA
ncbi:MAG TPA: type I restriction-modification enzyme R subunit C-terminal domain-containing protein [Verrucomicrobiae bacterium]